jgi:hypothetical protein
MHKSVVNLSNRKIMNRLCFSLIACILIISTNAQQKLSEKDYQRAESFLSYSTQKYIDRNFTTPNWISGDRFWYRTLTPQGSEFVLIDLIKKTKTPAFDAQKLAAALSLATGRKVSASSLPFQSFSFSDEINPFPF